MFALRAVATHGALRTGCVEKDGHEGQSPVRPVGAGRGARTLVGRGVLSAARVSED